MQSAFGIEHNTEISKARGFRLVRVPKHKRVYEGIKPTAPSRVKEKLNQAGDVPITIKGVGRAAGRGVGRVSSAFESHPGITGTALVTGGSVGGYKYLSEKPPKKKS